MQPTAAAAAVAAVAAAEEEENESPVPTNVVPQRVALFAKSLREIEALRAEHNHMVSIHLLFCVSLHFSSPFFDRDFLILW